MLCLSDECCYDTTFNAVTSLTLTSLVTITVGYELIIRELFIIRGFREEVDGKIPRNLWTLQGNYFCIEEMKYCKRLIARDYFIILRALKKNIRNI